MIRVAFFCFSWLSHLHSQRQPLQTFFYHHVPWYAFLNDGQYKYIRYLHPGIPEELYDLHSDP